MNVKVIAGRLCLVVLSASLLVLIGLFTGNANAFVDGPPPGTTGGFGEDTCRQCHFDYELNHASGSFRLDGIPESYTAGQEYVITLHLTHPQMERGGFELAARFSSGSLSGRQAGSFEALDDRVAIVKGKDGAMEYVRQTRSGSAVQPKGASNWSVRWRAPGDAAGPVVFHAAANAANFDDSPLGDYPYAQQVTSRALGAWQKRQ
jgi:hypothetical protein